MEPTNPLVTLPEIATLIIHEAGDSWSNLAACEGVCKVWELCIKNNSDQCWLNATWPKQIYLLGEPLQVKAKLQIIALGEKEIYSMLKEVFLLPYNPSSTILECARVDEKNNIIIELKEGGTLNCTTFNLENNVVTIVVDNFSYQPPKRIQHPKQPPKRIQRPMQIKDSEALVKFTNNEIQAIKELNQKML